jgi:hypothetical protein
MVSPFRILSSISLALDFSIRKHPCHTIAAL